MHKKYIAWQEKRPVHEIPANIHTDAALIDFVYSISVDISKNPQVYTTDDNTLWLYYAYSCFACESLFDEYATEMALIDEKYSISINGNVNGYESGEIAAKFTNNRKMLELTKKDVSANDFTDISDICIKIIFSDKDTKQAYFDVFVNLDYRKEYLATKRTAFVEAAFADCTQYNHSTYFRYIPLASDSYTSYTESLTIEQKKYLWVYYLQNGMSPIEFDDTLELLNREDLLSSFSWELSLRLALHEENIVISYDNKDFQVTTKDKKRLNFTYESQYAAEKLFLKLLFYREMKR